MMINWIRLDSIRFDQALLFVSERESECVCVCMHAVCVCVYTCIHTFSRTRTHTHTHTTVSAFGGGAEEAGVFGSVAAVVRSTGVCMCVCVCVHMHMCVRMWVCVHTCILHIVP